MRKIRLPEIRGYVSLRLMDNRALTGQLLAQYDEQLRTAAEVADCDDVIRIGPLWVAKFPERGRGFVTYRSLDGGDVDSLIDETISYFKADERIREFEWKTRGHDAPHDLLEHLTARGFELDDEETIMAGELEAVIAADDGLPEGYTLHKATTDDELREFERIAGVVFGDPAERSAARAEELVKRSHERPGTFEMWGVRNPRGAIVCSGRIDITDGTQWASVWGGACVESERGKGLYRAITAERARVAKARGKSYIHSDCTEYSRPILQRAGLLPITTSTPATWNREV